MRPAELSDTPIAGTQANTRSRTAGGWNWPLHVAFVATFVVFVALYAESFASLVYTWAHAGTYEYAFLIFPVAVFLIWMRRERLRQVTARPARSGLVLLAGLCAIWMAGEIADINLFRHFSVVMLIPGLVFTLYGSEVTRALAFPLGYLLFAVPFGDFMVGPLQDITAHLSVFALQMTSVPVLMTGRTILTPASGWHVAEACSGVKFFIATTAFGVLYANLFFASLGRRLVFIACALVVPIVANGLRVFFTILIGEYFGVEYATGTDHLIFGWQFFGTVLLLLFLAGWPWHEPERPYRMRAHHGQDRAPCGVSRAAVFALASVLVIASLPGWLYAAHAMAPSSAIAATPQLPMVLGDLPRRQHPAIETGARFAQADAHDSAYYDAQSAPVHVEYARYDGPPSSGHELITGSNRLYDKDEWKIAGRRPVSLAAGAPQLQELRLVQREGQAVRLLWYVYRVNDLVTVEPLEIKAWQAWYGLTARAINSSVLAMSTQAPDMEAARKRLANAAPAALRFWSQEASRP